MLVRVHAQVRDGSYASVSLLLQLRHSRDVSGFIFTFAGVSTLHAVVAPALNRFIENVYAWHEGLGCPAAVIRGRQARAQQRACYVLLRRYYHQDGQHAPARRRHTSASI